MKFKLITIIAVLFMFISCKDDDPVEPTTGSITVQMAQKVADKAFGMNSMDYRSPAGHPYQINRLKYYISEITFHKSDGSGTIYVDSGHLTDLNEPSSQSFNIGEIPPTKYDMMSFTYGFTKANNVKSYLPNTTTHQNMFWPIGLGPGAYHYMQYEGRYDSLESGVIKPFNLHTGPTHGADNSYRINLNLSTEIDINGNDWEIVLMMDLQEWLQNPTDYDYETFGIAIMPNQDAQEIMKANGQSGWSISSVKEK